MIDSYDFHREKGANITQKYISLIEYIRELYGQEGFIPLHAPRFEGNEKKYLLDCIDSTFVSTVGAYVDQFEAMMRELTGARYAIATTNGTSALHMALILAGVRDGDEVITQPLSFVATCNAIAYQRAHPVFVDVDRDTLGLSPTALRAFLRQDVIQRDAGCYNRQTDRRISAVVVMHTFGLPARIEELSQICDEWGLVLVEDAAESLGSKAGGRATGTFGKLGVYSFNGNKTVTCGGGGCIVTDDDELGALGKHLTTTAKVTHPWEFVHDQVGYNYRLPNLNAALACAQLEQLSSILANKRKTAALYKAFCAEMGITFLTEREGSTSNYWLNTILMDSVESRDAFLAYSNQQRVMTRPAWTLMTDLPAFSDAPRSSLENARWLAARLINIPSSAR